MVPSTSSIFKRLKTKSSIHLIKPLLLCLIILYIFFSLFNYLPIGKTTTSNLNKISYTQVNSKVTNINNDYYDIAEHQNTGSKGLSAQTVLSLPSIPILDFGLYGGSTRLTWPLDSLANFIATKNLHTGFVFSSYNYSIENNTFVLGPEISCQKLPTIKLVFLNSHYNQLDLISELPKQYMFDDAISPIKIIIESIEPDGSVVITYNDAPLIIKPDNEFVSSITGRYGFGKYWEKRYLRNFSNAKVECFPNYVTSQKIKDEKLSHPPHEEKTASLCSQISALKTKQSCYSDVFSDYIQKVISENNFKLCDTIGSSAAGYDMKSQCFRDYAATKKDPSICVFANDAKLKNECYLQSGSPQSCPLLKTNSERNLCYHSTKQCELITQKDISDDCYFYNMGTAWERIGYNKAVQICQNMGFVSNKSNPIEFNQNVCTRELRKGLEKSGKSAIEEGLKN